MCKHEGPEKGFATYYCVKCKRFVCNKHARYKVIKKPTGNCEACWFLWFEKQGREVFGW